MIKRALIFGVVCVCLAVVFSGDTSANRYLRIGGIYVEIGSINTSATFKKLSNSPDEIWMLTNTITTTGPIALICGAPGNESVSHGEAFSGHPVKSTGFAPLTDDTTGGRKKKGEASGTVKQSFESQVQCVNPNWHVLFALPTSWTFVNTASKCIGPDIAPCSLTQEVDILEGSCALPAFDITDPSTYPQPGYVLDENNCVITDHTHNDI